MFDPFDVSMETYDEAIQSFISDAGSIISPDFEPKSFIKANDCTQYKSGDIDTSDYPAGTWFTYPGDGTVWVK
jgi:hypothetical protein